MAARKASTIGSNPLDQVVPIRPQSSLPPDDPEPAKVDRERVTVALPADLMERARNAVYWTPGATLAGLVEDAVADVLEQVEKRNGGPFKPRSSNLKPGRKLTYGDRIGDDQSTVFGAAITTKTGFTWIDAFPR